MNNVEIFKKDEELKSRYEYVINLLKSGDKIFHLKYWTGNRNYRTLVETDYNNMIDVLNYYNIKFELGNDAPKGGVTGDYIELKVDKRNANYKKLLNLEVA